MAVQGVSEDGAKLIGWSVIPVPLATIAIILRFISRWKHQIVGADDYMMLLAYFLYIGLYVVFILFATVGHAGWPQSELSYGQVEDLLKVFFCVQFLYALVGPTIKIAILLLYRRLFTSFETFMRATLITGSLVLIWCIGVLFSVIFECVPVGTYWQPNVEGRTCIDSQSFYWANGISNLVLDFVVLCLPAPVIWRLHMSVQKKMSLTAVFGLGIFVCIASVLRIAYLWKINFDNLSGSIAIPTIWSSIEPGFGIVAGCLPTFPGLFNKGRRNSPKEWPDLRSSRRSWLRNLLSRNSGKGSAETSIHDMRLTPKDGSSNETYVEAVDPSDRSGRSSQLGGAIGVRRDVSVVSV